MEVRKALRKSTWKGDAMTKSPMKIISAANLLSQEIQGLPDWLQVMQRAEIGTQEFMEIQENSATVPIPKVTGDDDDDEDDAVGDLMEETDADEESVDISASSSISTGSNPRLHVTNQQGKLDMSKVRNWSIPKLKKPDMFHRSQTSERDGSRGHKLRRTLPLNVEDVDKPQASSTPHPTREDGTSFVERVKSKLNKSELTKPND